MNEVNCKTFDILSGLIPIKINVSEDNIHMKFSNGDSAVWCHNQDCCEDVYIENINGDFNDLIDNPLTVVEERTSDCCIDDSTGKEYI